MILVENLFCALEVEVVFGLERPGQRENPLEVGSDHAVLRRGSRQPLQAAELAIDRLEGLLGKVRRLDPLTQLFELRLLGVALAELVLDRLHLLAQDELALALLELRGDLRLDLGLQLEQLQLAGKRSRQFSQALADVG